MNLERLVTSEVAADRTIIEASNGLVWTFSGMTDSKERNNGQEETTLYQFFRNEGADTKARWISAEVLTETEEYLSMQTLQDSLQKHKEYASVMENGGKEIPEQPCTCNLWYHPGTNGVYEVLMDAVPHDTINRDLGVGEHHVVYRNVQTGAVFVRRASEFLGKSNKTGRARFVRLTEMYHDSIFRGLTAGGNLTDGMITADKIAASKLSSEPLRAGAESPAEADTKIGPAEVANAQAHASVHVSLTNVPVDVTTKQ